MKRHIDLEINNMYSSSKCLDNAILTTSTLFNSFIKEELNS